MKRTMMILLAILMMLSVCMTTCAESGKRVAKDGAQMQTDDPTMPTRLPPENGTKILLHFGDTVIPGVLNDSETAQEIYGSQVNIGVITCPLSDIAALNGSYDVLIELDESEEEEEPMMQMKINDTPVTVAWEDNESVSALKELAANDLTIQMSMYGGFEQVGSIGQRLPSSDVQTSTSSGDIVLYSSNQLVVFYGSNSWAYTRLGHITDKTPETESSFC